MPLGPTTAAAGGGSSIVDDSLRASKRGRKQHVLRRAAFVGRAIGTGGGEVDAVAICTQRGDESLLFVCLFVCCCCQQRWLIISRFEVPRVLVALVALVVVVVALHRREAAAAPSES